MNFSITKVIVFSVIGLNVIFSPLSAQSLFWVGQMSGTSVEEGKRVAVDGAGNIFTTGWFSGTVDFDPKSGVFNLTSTGIQDIFVSKIDAAGNFLWAAKIGGTSSDWSGSVAVDLNGNVYVTGTFQSNTDFNPGAGTYFLNGSGPTIFLLKLDGLGNFLWARKMGNGGDFANDISIDNNGLIHLTGYFNGTVDVDTGPSIFNITSAGNADIFISTYDSNGDFIGAMRMGGTDFDNSQSIALDGSGNIYTSGSILFAAGSSDILISKLDNNRNLLWSFQLGGALDDQANDIATDNFGNVYCTGSFNGTVDFDPSPAIFNLTSAGNKDVFIVKLDASGAFVWAKKMGGTGSDDGTSILTDVLGNFYVSGYFAGNCNFDPGMSNYLLTSNGNLDCFISKFNSSASHLWSIKLGGIDMDRILSACLDNSQNIVCTGGFKALSDFDPGPVKYLLNAAGDIDIFIGTIINQGLILPVELIEFSVKKTGDDVNISWVTATELNSDYFIVEKSGDTKVWQTLDVVIAAGLSNHEEKYFLIDNHPFAGNNYYRLKQIDFDGNFRYSEIKMAQFNISQVTFLMYPNPSKEILTIDYSSVEDYIETVTLFNSQGKKIITIDGTANSQVYIRVADLDPGVYMVVLVGTKEFIWDNVIIN